MSPKIDFSFQLIPVSSTSRLNTQTIFDQQHRDTNKSSFDLFKEVTSELHKLTSLNMNSHLANLVLLGYVSAVESYFRRLFKKIILIDVSSRLACEKKLVTFGAAISHDREGLPDALLEDISFASRDSILEGIKNFLGVKGHTPSTVLDTLESFTIVCHLRHCSVHRFGYLGSKNAINLGLTEHQHCIDKPLCLDFDSLQTVMHMCTNTVKTVNNYLFVHILTRTVENSSIEWSWDFRKDKKLFKPYYDIFSSTQESVKMIDVYNNFRQSCKSESE